MSKLMSRGAVLTLSRLSNFAVLMLSPLILVRLLSVGEYGRYQEFMLYAMLALAISELGIDASLTYFIPKYPSRERQILSQTSAVVLTGCLSCIALIFLATPLILTYTSYDFIAQLAAYVFCFVNLNWLEYYWIAKRRTDLVLYYSAGRVTLRISTLLLAAYLTRDVEVMLWAIVAAEAVRLLAVAAYLRKRRMFTFDWKIGDVKEQLGFSAPMGLSSLVQSTGRSIGKLFISTTLGPAALALYSVGSYLIPLVRLIRGSIADVVFPEMVKAAGDPESAVRLWQRTNVLYCALLFPAYTLLVTYGDLIIRTLFTSAYLPALPIFEIYMLFLLRRCFNFDVLMRSSGRTGFILTGSLLALITNILLMVALRDSLPFIGPAIAFIASEILLELYYWTRLGRYFAVPRVRLVDWKAVGSVTLGCIAGLPVLIGVKHLPGPAVPFAIVGSIGFLCVCWLIAYRLGVHDIGKLVSFGLSPLRRMVRS